MPHTDPTHFVPVLAPQDNPAPSPDTLSLTVLQLRLQQRRTREQLADQGIMPREYLPLPFSSWFRGLCSPWALLGHCVAPAACSDPHIPEQSATRGLCFQPCRNVMIPGAVQCIYHTDCNAPAQTEVKRDAYFTPSKISAALTPVPEVTVAGQAYPAQAEDSQSCSWRKGRESPVLL